jgi:hypothetical protein
MKWLLSLFWILLMPVSATISHALSATTPDNTSYEIRPTHWNSGHDVTLSLNISATEISGQFSNANGISFGLSGDKITGSHNAITTGALSNHSHGVSFTSGSVAFQTLSFTNSNGISFNSGTQGIFGSHNAITTGALSNHSHGVSFTSGSVAFQTLSFTNSNGISFNSGTQGIFGSHNALTTAAASDHSHGNPTLNLTNLSGTTASNSAGFTLSLSAAAAGAAVINFSAGTTSSNIGSVVFSNANGVTFGLNASTITASVAAAGGGATLSFFEPYLLDAATVTSSGGINTLFLVPFVLANNYTFAQLNMIGSAAAASTSAGQTNSLRITGASSQRRVASYTISNTNYHDFFLFSKGTGGFSTNLGTFFSTQHSVVTIQGHTYDHSASNGAGSTASHTVRSSNAVTFSYPTLTSGTMTSINAASTITTWAPGYSSFTSSTSNSTSNTWNTTTTGSTSMTATWPGSSAWASNKMIPFAFATSLTPGEYWLGWKRSSLTSSSSSMNVSHGSVSNNSYTTTLNASNLTQTKDLSCLGMGTFTLLGSLGWLGSVSANSMGPMPGHGSFSATYSPASTYVNNLGQPVGMIALSNILTAGSFHRPWFQLANTRV